MQLETLKLLAEQQILGTIRPEGEMLCQAAGMVHFHAEPHSGTVVSVGPPSSSLVGRFWVSRLASSKVQSQLFIWRLKASCLWTLGSLNWNFDKWMVFEGLPWLDCLASQGHGSDLCMNLHKGSTLDL